VFWQNFSPLILLTPTYYTDHHTTRPGVRLVYVLVSMVHNGS